MEGTQSILKDLTAEAHKNNIKVIGRIDLEEQRSTFEVKSPIGLGSIQPGVQLLMPLVFTRLALTATM